MAIAIVGQSGTSSALIGTGGPTLTEAAGIDFTNAAYRNYYVIITYVVFAASRLGMFHMDADNWRPLTDSYEIDSETGLRIRSFGMFGPNGDAAYNQPDYPVSKNWTCSYIALTGVDRAEPIDNAGAWVSGIGTSPMSTGNVITTRPGSALIAPLFANPAYGGNYPVFSSSYPLANIVKGAGSMNDLYSIVATPGTYTPATANVTNISGGRWATQAITLKAAYPTRSKKLFQPF